MSGSHLSPSHVRASLLLPLAAAVALFAASCDGGDDDGKSANDPQGVDNGAAGGGGATPKAAFCDALSVVQKHCAECHDGAGTGPMKLLTYEDFVAEAPVTKGKKVWEVAKERLHDPKKPMPPRGGLSAEELAVLDGWLAGGAQPGDNPSCPSLPSDPGPTQDEPWPPPGAERCEKVVAYAVQPGDGQKTTVAPGAETHPQFVFDAPWGDQQVHAVGFRPVIDNKKVLHHWILYPNANRGLEGMIIGWAPGGEKARRPLPEDVGVNMPTGPQSLRLDIHYYNLSAGAVPETDASGVEICWTTKLRKYGAQVFMQFGSLRIDIPPQQEKEIMSSCTVQTTDNQPVYIMSTSPHAHTFARKMKFTVERDEGGQTQVTTLYDGDFVFEEQQAKFFDKPLELRPGDRVVTRCTYKNDTNQRVTWGEDTGNEMCFNYVIYYPHPNLSCAPGTGILGFVPPQ